MHRRTRSSRIAGLRQVFAISLALMAIVLAFALVKLTAHSTSTGIKSAAQAIPTTTSGGSGLALSSQAPATAIQQTGSIAHRGPIIGLRSSPAITPAMTIGLLLLIGIASLTMTQRFRTVARIALSKPSRILGISTYGIRIRDRFTAWIKSRQGLPAGLTSVMAADTRWQRAGIPATSSA